MSKTAPQAKRKRFGLLVSTLNGVYQSEIWQGISKFTQEGDYDLLTFVGREIDHPVYDSNDYNYIYDLAVNENLDGLFCVTATICNYVGGDRVERFIDPYRKFPIVNIGRSIPGIPRVGSDNQIGMRFLMNHFLDDHKFTKIAFIRGPSTNREAEERYATYQACLKEHGIDFDPDLVYQGYFSMDSGMVAARQLLQKGPLSIQALVVANDDMAIGALKVLKEAGIRVPQDLAVSGFDDEEDVQFLESPLTSVRQSFGQICEMAGKVMLSLLSGGQPPMENLAPSELVIRESCGCMTAGGRAKSVDHLEFSEAVQTIVEIIQTPHLPYKEFLTRLNEKLWLSHPENLYKLNWHLVLNKARTELRSTLFDAESKSHIESLFDGGLALVSQLERRLFDRDIIFHKDLILAISDFIQNVNFGLNEDASLDALPLRLTNLNITGFALVLFPEASIAATLPNQAMIKRIYSTDSCFAPNSEDLVFDTTQAIPQGILDQSTPRQFLFLPIVNHGLKFGYCCFESSPTQYYVYGVIQEQLGILLNREHLAKEIIQKRTQELVETEKMSALRILVASLAHEINTPIGTAFTASSYHQHQLDEIANSFTAGTMTKKEFEDFIHEGKEAARIIFNNLSRTVELVQSFKKISVDNSSGAKRWFKLKEYVEDILTMLSPRYRHLRLNLITECSETLTINSYPGAFSQIMTNLMENAIVHAFHQRDTGNITNQLRMDRGTLEWIFKDDGAGMSETITPRVFEPFFTTRRSSGGSGLGLHIVYNLVTQNLRGAIGCSSVLGEGTRFVIRIPLSQDDIKY